MIYLIFGTLKAKYINNESIIDVCDLFITFFGLFFPFFKLEFTLLKFGFDFAHLGGLLYMYIIEIYVVLVVDETILSLFL